jgi:hypothetical protein
MSHNSARALFLFRVVAIIAASIPHQSVAQSGGLMPASQIVSYRVDEKTVATFEIEPIEGFGPAASAGSIIAEVRGAVGPAIEAARAVLAQTRTLGSDLVQVRFGVRVSGSKDWLIAKTAGEGTFEVTLAWRPND